MVKHNLFQCVSNPYRYVRDRFSYKIFKPIKKIPIISNAKSLILFETQSVRLKQLVIIIILYVFNFREY